MTARGQQLTCLFGILLVDPARQLADAAAFAETTRIAQHHHLLGQGMTGIEVFLQAAGTEVFAADRLQPLQSLRAVPAGFGVTAQIAEYRTGLHRRQLVLVAQQYQTRMGRQGIEQVGHHFQVNHRGFIHHQHVQRQWITQVMPEVAGARTAAQQAMNRGDLGRDFFPHVVGHCQ